MKQVKRKYFFVILALLIVYIVVYILTNSNLYNVSSNETRASKRERNSNQIELILDIQDIYRIDISCEFITKHLGAKIIEKYKNSKMCSASSLRSELDEDLKKSIAYKTSDTYNPIFEIEEKNFNIFKSDTKKYLKNFNLIQNGGKYEPILIKNPKCDLNQIDFIAFVVPYYNRLENLNILILNLHNYLTSNKKYQFSYIIVVAEQSTSAKFNKGQIINTAVKYINDNYKNVDCIVLHDVDLIPSVNDSSIDYRCRQMPVHLTNQVFVTKSKWNRVYNQFLTGGILSLRPQHFVSSNGFSNSFSGWGGEDDDWTLRMFNNKLCIIRPDNPVAPNAPFLMLKHQQAAENNQRYTMLGASLERQSIDGYNRINEHTKVSLVTQFPLFTHILIDISQV